MTREQFARMLAGADVIAGRHTLPFDLLPAEEQERHRATARALLDSVAVPSVPTDQTASDTASDTTQQGRAELRDRIAALFRCPPGAERLGGATPGEIADAVLAVPPATTDRAAEIRAAAFKAAANYVRGHSADERYGKASISTALCAVSDELCRMADQALAGPGRVADETQQDEPVRTPCSDVPCDDGPGEPCARHEEEQAHAEGEHEYCGVTCEVAMSTEAMRATIIGLGIPGTKGMLDELLRRAAAGQLPAAVAPRPETTENAALWDELHRRDTEADQPHAAVVLPAKEA